MNDDQLEIPVDQDGNPLHLQTRSHPLSEYDKKVRIPSDLKKRMLEYNKLHGITEFDQEKYEKQLAILVSG